MQGIADLELGPAFHFVSFGDLTAQPDGGVLVVYSDGSKASSVIRRYESDGDLDTAFEQPVPPRPRVVLDDGKVLRTEPSGDGEALVRLNADGSRDTTFGSDGESASVPFPISLIEPSPSGKLLVAGHVSLTGMHGFPSTTTGFVARMEADGTLDTGFGAEGVVNLRMSEVDVQGVPMGIVAAASEEVVVGLRETDEQSTLVGLDADGGLDRDFGTAGSLRPGASLLALHALPSGKLLVVGTQPKAQITCCTHESDLFAARYESDGQPDASFGSNGSTVVDLGDADSASAVLWGADGSVLIGGSTTTLTTSCRRSACHETPSLARLTPTGSLDAGFGQGGVVRLGAGAGGIDGGVVRSLARRAGGGVFAAGDSDTVAFLAALNSSGELDPGFGGDGVVTERSPAKSSAQVEAVAVDRRGRLLLAGSSSAGGVDGPPGGVVIRLRPNGALDRSFGGGTGYAKLPVRPESIAVDRYGRPLVLGSLTSIRLTASGKIDNSFGQEGFVSFGRGRGPRPRPTLQLIQGLPNGASLVAGHWRQRALVLRLRPDGRLHPSFGRRGIVRLGFGPRRSCRAIDLAVQPNRRILLAGSCEGQRRRSRRGSYFSPESMMLARLLPNGTPDRSFGRRGRLMPRRVGRQSRATGIATQRGKILVAARFQRGRRKADLLMRLRQGGALDRSFARAGIARVRMRPLNGRFLLSEPLGILPTPKRILLVRPGRVLPVVAFRRNGRRDRRFARRSEIAPRRVSETYVPEGPAGGLQRGKLILAWTTQEANERGGVSPEIALQRLNLR